MKIRADFMSHVRVKTRSIKRIFSGRTSANKQQISTTTNNLQQIASSAQGERDLSTAMMLIQKARVIIQQALTVSNQISNMAMTTLRTGDTDYQKVGEHLSRINVSLGEYGMGVTAPPLPIKGDNIKTVQAELPAIRSNIEELTKTFKNSNPDLDVVKKIVGSLEKQNASLGKQQNNIETKLTAIADSYLTKTTGQPALPGVKKEISENPGQSLVAQGNINNEVALQLLG